MSKSTFPYIKELENAAYTKTKQYAKKRRDKILNFNLDSVMSRQNSFKLAMSGISTPIALVDFLLYNHLSISDSTMHGNIMEEILTFLLELTGEGGVSKEPGIDLDLSRDGILHFIQLKSSPNWANFSQKTALNQLFGRIKERYYGKGQMVENILGIISGKEDMKRHDTHSELYGKRLWEFMSGYEHVDEDVLNCMVSASANTLKDYNRDLAVLKVNLQKEIQSRFCSVGNTLDWNKIISEFS